MEPDTLHRDLHRLIREVRVDSREDYRFLFKEISNLLERTYDLNGRLARLEAAARVTS